MSWCCLTSGDERSAIKIEGYAGMTIRAKRYQNAAALLIFLRRTTILNSSFEQSFHPQSKSSTPRGRTPNPEV